MIADLIAQLDVVNCDAQDLRGFGLAGCKRDRDRVVTIEISRAGFYYEDAQNLAYIRAQQQLGNLMLLQGVLSFEEEDAKPTYDTRPGSGIDKLAGEIAGKIKFSFDNGMTYAQNMRLLNSFGDYNMAVYDVTGAKFLTKTKSGKVKGFSLANLYTYPYRGSDGTKSSVVMAETQLLELAEVDRQVMIQAETLDFSPSELTDVNDITLNLQPIAAGTTVSFDPLLSDRTHQVPNMAIVDLKLTKNGSPLTPTVIAYNTTTKKVDLTVPALVATDVVTIQTNYVTTGKNIILIDDILYKSGVETAIVS